MKIFLKLLTNNLIDWLAVLFGVVIILWFFITQPVLSIPQTQTVVMEDNDNLKRHVRALVDDYSPRTVEYGNLNITANYIYENFIKSGATSYQPYWTLMGRYSNVILELGPDTDEIFVIGAHYDAPSSSMGIDGNASGVATLIELARYLSSVEDKLALRVHIVAYPLSQGYPRNIENMGSYNHAQLIKNTEKDVRLMISLDGVGRYSSTDNSQSYPYKFMKLFYPDAGDYISLIGRLEDYKEIRKMKHSFGNASNLPLYSFNVPNNFTHINSYDHINYQSLGYPAVLLTDTAKYRKLDKSSLNIVEKLDYKKMALLVRSLSRVAIDAKPNKIDKNTTQVASATNYPQKIVKTGGGVKAKDLLN